MLPAVSSNVAEAWFWITVPAGVDVKLDGRTISVKGPKGTLEREIPGTITITQNGDTLVCERPNEENKTKAMHGLTRSLVNNMVIGVTDGFSKNLEIVVSHRSKSPNDDMEAHIALATNALGESNLARTIPITKFVP